MSSFDIILAPDVWARMWAYTEECQYEVGAFGYCTDSKDGYIYVDDIFLVPQEVTGTSVEFDEEGLHYAIDKAQADGRLHELRFCAHSHVNMGVFWSITDDELCRSMGDVGAPWFANAVFNKKGEVKGRIDIFDHGVEGLAPIKLDLNVRSERGEMILEEAKKELDEYVTKAKPEVKTLTMGKGSHSTGQGDSTHSAADQAILVKDFIDKVDEVTDKKDGEALAMLLNTLEYTHDTCGNVHFFDDDGIYYGDEYDLALPKDWYIIAYASEDAWNDDSWEQLEWYNSITDNDTITTEEEHQRMSLLDLEKS